ncbi:alpha/beta hydrolase fold domain-containing protein [Streptomyces anulatus]
MTRLRDRRSGRSGRGGCGCPRARDLEGTAPGANSSGGPRSRAGWVFGDDRTHDRLFRELAVGAGAAGVFPVYDRAPEAKYPTQVEQNYAVGRWVLEHGEQHGMDTSRDGMKWFWDAYIGNPAHRTEAYASPLRSSLEQLRGLPTTLVITDEADVLRDEGEEYANRLREAGVDVTSVRVAGMVHDFLLLDSLRDTRAANVARKLAVDALRTALHED